MPRQLTKISVEDKRGTRLELTIYISSPMLHDYIKEVIRVWADEWGGNADTIHIVQQGDSYEWIQPGELKEQEPHNP